MPACLFVAVASGTKVLASHSAAGSEGLLATTLQVLQSPGWSSFLASSAKKIEVAAGGDIETSLLFELSPPSLSEERFVFVAAVTGTYPRTSIFSSSSTSSQRLFRDLSELVAKHGSSAKALRRELKPLLQHYADPARVDKVAQVQVRLDSLRETVKETVRAATERDGLLQNLEVKSAHIRDSAAALQAGGAAARRNARWRYFKWTALVLFLLLGTGAAVVLTLNYTTTHWW